MEQLHQPLIIRAACLFLPMLLLLIIHMIKPVSVREFKAGVITSIWMFPIVLLTNYVAVQLGFWQFDTDGGEFLNIPVDLVIGWVILWAMVFPLAFRNIAFWIPVLVVLWLDIISMQQLAPAVILAESWVWFDVLLIFSCFIPGLFLFRWYANDQYLYGRVAFYVHMYLTYAFYFVPVFVFTHSNADWQILASYPMWMNSLMLQLFLIPGALGLTAVFQFALDGNGSPLPWDPPQRLVTTGPYAYMRNPMQVSNVITFLIMGLVFQHWAFALVAVASFLFSSGYAKVIEQHHLENRFQNNWMDYMQNVRSWFPRIKPWYPEKAATLYIAETCSQCSQLKEWLMKRSPLGIEIVPAESYMESVLDRITYITTDGQMVQGVHAVYRTLNHLHLGWAFCGWLFGLPVISHATQILTDALGGGPKPCRIENTTSEKSGGT